MALLLTSSGLDSSCQNSAHVQLQEHKDATNVFQEAGTHCVCMEK